MNILGIFRKTSDIVIHICQHDIFSNIRSLSATSHNEAMYTIQLIQRACSFHHQIFKNSISSFWTSLRKVVFSSSFSFFSGLSIADDENSSPSPTFSQIISLNIDYSLWMAGKVIVLDEELKAQRGGKYLY